MHFAIFFNDMISKCDLTDDMSADCWSQHALCVMRTDSPFISLTEIHTSSSNNRNKCCLCKIISFILRTAFSKRDSLTVAIICFNRILGVPELGVVPPAESCRLHQLHPQQTKERIPPSTVHCSTVFTVLINVLFIVTQRKTPAGRGDSLRHIFLRVFGSSTEQTDLI